MEDILVLVITEGQPIFIGKCGKIRNIFLGFLKKSFLFFQVETLWKLLKRSPTLITKVHLWNRNVFFQNIIFTEVLKNIFHRLTEHVQRSFLERETWSKCTFQESRLLSKFWESRITLWILLWYGHDCKIIAKITYCSKKFKIYLCWFLHKKRLNFEQIIHFLVFFVKFLNQEFVCNRQAKHNWNHCTNRINST